MPIDLVIDDREGGSTTSKSSSDPTDPSDPVVDQVRPISSYQIFHSDIRKKKFICLYKKNILTKV